MSRMLEVVSRAFASVAAVCAVLAVLAVPATARADPLVPCDVQCAACSQSGGISSPYEACMAACQAGLPGGDPCRVNPEEIGNGLANCPVMCLDCKATNNGGVITVTGNCQPTGVQGCDPCKGCGLTTAILPDGSKVPAVYCKA